MNKIIVTVVWFSSECPIFLKCELPPSECCGYCGCCCGSRWNVFSFNFRKAVTSWSLNVLTLVVHTQSVWTYVDNPIISSNFVLCESFLLLWERRVICGQLETLWISRMPDEVASVGSHSFLKASAGCSIPQEASWPEVTCWVYTST